MDPITYSEVINVGDIKLQRCGQVKFGTYKVQFDETKNFTCPKHLTSSLWENRTTKINKIAAAQQKYHSPEKSY